MLEILSLLFFERLIGETFEIDGVAETLSVACAVCGVAGFESDKRYCFDAKIYSLLQERNEAKNILSTFSR